MNLNSSSCVDNWVKITAYQNSDNKSRIIPTIHRAASAHQMLRLSQFGRAVEVSTSTSDGIFFSDELTASVKETFQELSVNKKRINITSSTKLRHGYDMFTRSISK